MEASITLFFYGKTNNIIDILNLFKKSGWGLLNKEGEMEFLPIGDIGEFEWVNKKNTEEELYTIISQKMVRNEMIGINLFFQNGVEGITLMTEDAHKIVLGLSINRRLINSVNTDMGWYFENLILKLIDNQANLLSYCIEEYND